jgi:hypothetical protein
MGFGLVIGFIEHLQSVTINSYSAIANSHSAIHYNTRLSLLRLLYVHQLSGNNFQQYPMLLCSCSYWLATFPQLSALNPSSLLSTNLAQLDWWSDIISEHTQQITSLFPHCCGCHGITYSVTTALSTWCWTMWQHRFLQLSYCVTSPQMHM